MRLDNRIVTVKGERAGVQIIDTLDEETPYGLLIFTVVAYQVGAVLPALQRIEAKSVQFTFVTFEPERPRDAAGADRCSFGMPFVQAMPDTDGKLKPTISKSQKTILSQQRRVEVFIAAGLPALGHYPRRPEASAAGATQSTSASIIDANEPRLMMRDRRHPPCPHLRTALFLGASPAHGHHQLLDIEINSRVLACLWIQQPLDQQQLCA